jgi:adenosylmethionine-8-amino-7-oxononanoate aminotransferase
MNDSAVLFMKSGSGEPLYIDRAEGAYLFTRDGRKLLDAAGGSIVVNVGQGREELAEVAREQVRQLSYVLPVWLSPARERLVQRLRKWTPAGLDRFFFTSGGSEAVEAALKFAFLYQRVRGRPKKTRIISRWLSYHGNSFAALSVGGNRGRRADFESVLTPWPKIPPTYCYRCPWHLTPPSCGIECAQALEKEIQAQGAENIAAFVAEPIVGSSGAVIPPVAEYWPQIAEICRRHDILLIADEVMTGFGRTGRRFAVEHWNIRPDVLVGGKGLAGGYAPMGMIAVDSALVEECEKAGADFMFYTYSAQPLGCALAERVLEIMEREGLVENAARVGATLGRRLREVIGSHPLVGDLRGMGLFWGVEIVADRDSRQPFAPGLKITQRILSAARERGVCLYPSVGMAGEQGGDGVMIAPPLIVGEAEVELIVAALRDSLDLIHRNYPR